MEYPAFNYQLNPKEQALYCDVKVGPYDKWVIEYGYSQALSDEQKEKERLDKITARSIEHQLAYGNDGDDMRTPGRGIDPDVNIFDLSSDPVAYGAERCELVKVVLPKLKEHLITSNESYAELLQSFLIATKEYGTQTSVMTRQIGGVHYDRAYAGQGSSVKPLEPVSEVKQKEAMKALAKYAFAGDVWSEAIPTFNYLLDQRRGFSQYSKSDDPKIHDRILDMQSECLNHLMHPRVHQRIIDSYMYGNTYSIDEVMYDLTQAIFESDLKGEVNTVRQNLQIEYTHRLIDMLDLKNKYDYVSQGVALSELKRIQKMEVGNVAGSALTKAHRAHVVKLIEDALSAK
jgi:hypothetical protein